MSRGFTPAALPSTIGVLAVLACGGSYREAPVPEPARPSSPTRNVVTATCRSYNADARTMDAITGVSFALRVITFRVDENTEVRIRGERADMADLDAGRVVRIEYRITPNGNMADKIEEVLDATEMR